MMKKKIWMMGALIAGCIPGVNGSEIETKADDPVDTGRVSVTATMTEKAVEKAPGSVGIITAAEIQEMGATTVAEALETAVGLIVSSDTGRAQIPSVRGTGNKRTLVRVDGRRLAPGYKDFVDVNQIPVTMIRQIEIIRGPGSAIYGSDTIGGVVDIITKETPNDLEVGALARYGGHGDKDTWNFEGSTFAGSKVGRFGFLVSGGLRNKDRWNADSEMPEDGDEETLSSAAGRLSFDISDHHILTAGCEYSNMQRDGELSLSSHLMMSAYRSEHEDEIEFAPEANVTGEEDSERFLDPLEAHYTLAAGKSHLLTPLKCQNVGNKMFAKKKKASKGLVAIEKLDSLISTAPDAVVMTGDTIAVQKALARTVRKNPALADAPALRNHAVYSLPRYIDAGILEYSMILRQWADVLATEEEKK